jgi:hypothetical protein
VRLAHSPAEIEPPAPGNLPQTLQAMHSGLGVGAACGGADAVFEIGQVGGACLNNRAKRLPRVTFNSVMALATLPAQPKAMSLR